MAKHRLEKMPPLSIPPSITQGLANTPSLPSTPTLPARPPSPERHTFIPGDSTVFLTALAGQERRVLELREELRNAETELERLKQQWALHETAKKQNGTQQLEQLQPIYKSIYNTKPINSDDRVGVFKDRERRRATLVTTKQSQRTVFSGSRHTKTLSLLSPSNNLIMTTSVIMATKSPRNSEHRSSVSGSFPQKACPSTINRKNSSVSYNHSARELPREAILETGKQLVGELREGLWTFFEDLKQATVGDEAASKLVPKKIPIHSVHSARNQNSNQSGGSSDKDTTCLKGTKIEPTSKNITKTAPKSANQDNEGSSPGIETTPLKCDIFVTRSALEQISTQQQHQNSDALDSDDDGWDNWDSPKPKDLPCRWSTSSATSDSITSMSSPLTDKSSPRSSVSSDVTPRPKKAPEVIARRDNIPWPTLTKLTPLNLKRTASTLMTEWEKNLVSPEDTSMGE